jgi:hypothetical protein
MNSLEVSEVWRQDPSTEREKPRAERSSEENRFDGIMSCHLEGAKVIVEGVSKTNAALERDAQGIVDDAKRRDVQERIGSLRKRTEQAFGRFARAGVIFLAAAGQLESPSAYGSYESGPYPVKSSEAEKDTSLELSRDRAEVEKRLFRLSGRTRK